MKGISVTFGLLLFAASCGDGGESRTAQDEVAETSTTSTSEPPTTTTSNPPTTTTSNPPSTERPPPQYVFPVDPPDATSYIAAHHDYPATDIFAPCGSPVLATIDGVIAELSAVDHWDPSTNAGETRGGLSVTLSGDDGVRYYGSHLSEIAPTVAPGVRVAAGDVLGNVGDTGSAAGTGCHLHFGISPPCGIGDWEVRRGTIPPAPYLDAWRAGDMRSPFEEVEAWRADHADQCPG